VGEPDPFFAEHGWQVVRGAVGAEVLAELLATFDRIFPPSLHAQPAERTPMVESVAPSRAYPAIARYATDAAVAGHVARALGCRRVQLLQETLLLKLPRNGGRIEWHQDHTYTGFLEPAATVSVRLALTDCLVDNGCLRVVDGSHRWGFFGETRALSAPSIADALGLLPAALGDRAREAARPVELRAGDLSLHHCLTFHGSLENTSALPRKTLVVRFCDADCKVVPARLPAALAQYFPTDGEGHLSPAAFPIVYAER
jgi:ectoine hydroxylase-related dioxygenase (phytanoyl-CoA dioxygenase family)